MKNVTINHCLAPLLWIGIVLMSIRIRLSIMMQIQIQIQIQIRIRILPHGYTCRKVKNFVEIFIHSSVCLHCFIFQISLIGATFLNILESTMKVSGKKLSSALHFVAMDTDPPK